MSTKFQLHQFLSKTGRFKSKEAIIDAIHRGQILVDGMPITDKGYQINPNTRKVTYKDEELTRVEKIYIVMNKPDGFVCARFTRPEPDKRSIFELLGQLNLSQRTEQSIFTVGRLDEDTTGLLLLTNDGDFCNAVINAGARIPKVYRVLLAHPLADAEHRALKGGVTIELEENNVVTPYTTRPAKVEIDVENRSQIYITIDEGKKRQIRRMICAVGNDVIELERVRIGDLTLAELGLRRGKCVKIEKPVF